MALKHNYTFLCELAIPDAVTGQFSFIHLFENVNTDKAPAIVPKVTIVCNLEGDPSDTFRVDLVSPSGVSLLKIADDTIGLPPPDVRPEQTWSSTVVFQAQPLVLPELGVYCIVVRSADGEVYRRDVFVGKSPERK